MFLGLSYLRQPLFLGASPLRFECGHRFFARGCIAFIMHRYRELPSDDGPEPRLAWGRVRGFENPTDATIIVENDVVVRIGPNAAIVARRRECRIGHEGLVGNFHRK